MRKASVGVLLFLVFTPAALAGSVLPSGSDYNALGGLLSGIATKTSGGLVTVRCYDPSTWTTPDGQSHQAWSLPGQINLSPDTCQNLLDYATADQKPTVCTKYLTVNKVVKEKVRYRKTIRVKRHGKWVKLRVWRTKIVKHPTAFDVPNGTGPCWKPDVQEFALGGYRGYEGYAKAIETFAHEMIHTQDWVNGIPQSETHAECAGMALMPQVAVDLGGTAEDGQAMQSYYVTQVRPKITDPAYTQPC